MKFGSTYDVLIVGAGVAGCCTAIQLHNLNPKLRIAIIDRNANDELSKFRISETLPPQAYKPLSNLRIWEEFTNCQFARTFGTSAVWGSTGLYHNEFILSPYGSGWHIDRNVFDKFLMEQCKIRGVEIRTSTSLTKVKREKGQWYCKCSDEDVGQEIYCDFVVDATGKKSTIASRLGSQKLVEDRLVAISCSFSKNEDYTNQIKGNGSLVESVEYGWWYSASKDGCHVSVCFMTDADIARSLKLNRLENFKKLLAQAEFTKTRVKDHLTGIKIRAAHSQILDCTKGDAWLAVGDSASSYDPISSMGIFKSMMMSQYAGFAIYDYLKGDEKGLSKYNGIVLSDFRAYQKKKITHYGEEKRYQDSTFWKRRA